MKVQYTPRQFVSMLQFLDMLTYDEFKAFYPKAAESYVDEKWCALKKNSAHYLMYLDDCNIERMFLLLASKLPRDKV